MGVASFSGLAHSLVVGKVPADHEPVVHVRENENITACVQDLFVCVFSKEWVVWHTDVKHRAFAFLVGIPIVHDPVAGDSCLELPSLRAHLRRSSTPAEANDCEVP